MKDTVVSNQLKKDDFFYCLTETLSGKQDITAWKVVDDPSEQDYVSARPMRTNGEISEKAVTRAFSKHFAGDVQSYTAEFRRFDRELGIVYKRRTPELDAQYGLKRHRVNINGTWDTIKGRLHKLNKEELESIEAAMGVILLATENR